MPDENENNNENRVAEEIATPPVEQQSEPQTEQPPAGPVLDAASVQDSSAPKPQPESISNPHPSEPISEPAPEIEPKKEVAGTQNGGNWVPTTLETMTEQIQIDVPKPTTESSPSPQPEVSVGKASFIRDLLAKANYAIRSKKMHKLEKIIELAKWNPTITNDDIQKMLRVSHNTATNYLNELVKQNKLVRLGHPKHAKYKLL